MLDKIMYTIGNILMVVVAGALVFLIRSWKVAKRKQREAALDNPPFARELMPMGAVTYAIACSHCKNRGPKGNDKAAADRCHRCRCEIESGFEIDPATFPVRCKDCRKRYNPKECPMCVRVYGEQHDVTHDDGYCDRGERRSDVETG